MNTNRILTGLTIAGAIASAAPAHADPTTADYAQYVNDLTLAGITNVSAAGIVKAGQLACEALAEGETMTQLINGIASGPNALPAVTAVVVVSYAISDLCPQYGSQNGSRASAPAPVSQPVPVTIASALT